MAGEFSISGLVGKFDYSSILQQIQQLKSQQIYMMQARQDQLNQKKAVINDIKNILSGMKDVLSGFDDRAILNAKSIDISNDSILSATVKDPTKAQVGTYNIQVNQLAKNHILASDTTFSDKDSAISGLSSGTLKITINGSDLNIGYDSSYSLQAIADKINTESSIWNFDVRATIVNVSSSSTPSYKLIISSTKTGVSNQISISDDGNLAGILNLQNVQTPQDAQINIDGVLVSRSSNQFDDVLEGISFTLKTTGNTVVSVGEDKNSIKQVLSKFVDSYNNLVEKIKAETGKNGKLSGEYFIDRIKNDIFREIQDLVFSGIFDFDRNSGKISLNSSKLDQVLSNTSSTTSSSLIETKGQLFTKLSDIKSNLTNFLNNTILSTGTLGSMISSYDKQISSIQDSIDRMTQRVQMEIDILKRQFIMMESLQAQYNAISARIQATFGLNNNQR